MGDEVDGHVMVASVLTMDVATPLFLLDDGDVDVFGSLDALARYVEPVDAAGGHLRVFDSNGRRVDLRGDDVQSGSVFVGGGRTIVEPSQPPAYELDELVEALRSFIRRVGPARFGVTNEWLDEAPLDQLTARASEFLGVSY